MERRQLPQGRVEETYRTSPILGIMGVRNEADIIGQVLRAAAPMHDLLLVVDAASDDETVEEIRAVSREFPHVVLLGILPEPVRVEQIRPHVWSLFRSHVPHGSWWSFVDGDEFCHLDLRQAVVAAEAEGADQIQGAFATFVYTDREARDWEEGRETRADRTRPIEERRRYYRMEHWSPRLFRQGPLLRWTEETYMPEGTVRWWSRRVPYRHYQHRDLDQIRVRLRTRKELDLPESFRRVHYHWGYEVEEAIMPQDHPDLLRHEPGAHLMESASLEKVWVRGPLHRWREGRRARRRAERMPQPPPRFLSELDAGAIVAQVLASPRGPHSDSTGTWPDSR